jgi:hypothetical protein
MCSAPAVRCDIPFDSAGSSRYLNERAAHPTAATDEGACLQHAATAAFEAQYAPAYGVIIAALTEPMTTITVHRALSAR